MTKSEGYTMTKKNCKRKLSVLLMALVFATASAMASTISDVPGVDGVFNIDPMGAVNHGGQSIGYRTYDKFDLSQGNTANLKFDSGISTFVNMVNQKININGLLNTTKNGNFYNGNAVFVSPNGMVVGDHGVLNVGSLSVYTPTAPGMNMMKKGFESGSLTTTYQGKQIDLMEAIGWHGNAPIEIDGKIISRGDVNMVANTFTVGATGGIAAGATAYNSTNYNGDGQSNLISNVNASNADTIFNALVNYPAANSSVNIRTYDRANSGAKVGGVNVGGTIKNMGSGDLIIQNRGTNGLRIDAGANIINSNGELHLVNSKGSMTLGGDITGKGGFTHITTGAGSGLLNLTETGKVNSEGLKIC